MYIIRCQFEGLDMRFSKYCISGLLWLAQWIRNPRQCRGHGFYPWPRKIPRVLEQQSLQADSSS